MTSVKSASLANFLEARLTTQISLAGRFLVYVPSGGAAGGAHSFCSA